MIDILLMPFVVVIYMIYYTIIFMFTVAIFILSIAVEILNIFIDVWGVVLAFVLFLAVVYLFI
jgi:hypothetical protein